MQSPGKARFTIPCRSWTRILPRFRARGRQGPAALLGRLEVEEVGKLALDDGLPEGWLLELSLEDGWLEDGGWLDDWPGCEADGEEPCEGWLKPLAQLVPELGTPELAGVELACTEGGLEVEEVG
jgi:hypothetical protein